MNYYPNNNYYQNYSYGNSLQQQSFPTIQGKVVDNPDMVRVSEVPFGGFGVFPKGDLSEIYVKSWNNNGTTQINTYRPVQIEETQEVKEESLSQKIDELNKKLDTLMKNAETQGSTPTKPAAAKDVKINAF